MTNTEKLLNALNGVDDSYLLEVDKRIRAVKTTKRATLSSIAAVFVLVIGSFAFMISNTAWGNARYNVYGESAGGYFYYEIPYKGIYRYSPGGESELLVKVKRSQYYDFLVNDIGLYYMPDDKSIHMIPHNSDEADIFFEDVDSNYLNMYKYNSTDLLLHLDYSKDSIIHQKQIVVDGKTGKEESVVFEEIIYYNSASIDQFFDQGYNDNDAIEKSKTTVYTFGEWAIEYIDATPIQGNEDYVYRIDDNDNLMYINANTGDNDVLLHESDLSYKDLFSNGEYIYISDCVISDFGNEKYIVKCYEIEFDENSKPTGLKLIDENIIE